MDVISGSTPSRPPTGYRALVVDDEAALADVVASYLRRDHIEVTVCHSGAEALNAAREVDPDVDSGRLKTQSRPPPAPAARQVGELRR